MTLLSRLYHHSGIRWIAVGVAFLGLGLLTSYLLVGVLHLPVALGTLISLLLGAFARFFAIDAWVFENSGDSGTLSSRFWRYQIAHASAYAGGWALINGLVLAGMNYLVATLCATAVTTGFSMLSHFQWVWKRNPTVEVPDEVLPEIPS